MESWPLPPDVDVEDVTGGDEKLFATVLALTRVDGDSVAPDPAVRSKKTKPQRPSNIAARRDGSSYVRVSHRERNHQSKAQVS